MDRRELLSQMGGFLTAALGGGVLAAPALAGTGNVNVQAWLADVDRRARNTRELTLPDGVRRYLADKRLQPTLLGDAFAALASVTSFRELPEQAQQDPAVQARLHRDGEALGHSLLALTAYLESLGPEERRRSQQVLREEPGLAGLLAAGVRDEGIARGASEGRLDQLERLLGRVTWRLAHQNPDLLIDDCIDTVDRVADRLGLERQGADVRVPDWSPVARPTAPARLTAKENEQQKRNVGEVTKHVGQLVCLFGLMVGGVTGGFMLFLGAGIFLLGVTAAALIIVVGLVLIVVGAVMNNP